MPWRYQVAVAQSASRRQIAGVLRESRPNAYPVLAQAGCWIFCRQAVLDALLTWVSMNLPRQSEPPSKGARVSSTAVVSLIQAPALGQVPAFELAAPLQSVSELKRIASPPLPHLWGEYGAHACQNCSLLRSDQCCPLVLERCLVTEWLAPQGLGLILTGECYLLACP